MCSSRVSFLVSIELTWISAVTLDSIGLGAVIILAVIARKLPWTLLTTRCRMTNPTWEWTVSIAHEPTM